MVVLLFLSSVIKKQEDPKSIAQQEIPKRRLIIRVGTGKAGEIHSFIPFLGIIHLAPLHMLWAKSG